MGLIIIAAVVLNVLIGDGRFGQVPERIRRWILPARTHTAAEGKTDDAAGN
jgi:hypothetical protein